MYVPTASWQGLPCSSGHATRVPPEENVRDEAPPSTSTRCGPGFSTVTVKQADSPGAKAAWPTASPGSPNGARGRAGQGSTVGSVGFGDGSTVGSVVGLGSVVGSGPGAVVAGGSGVGSAWAVAERRRGRQGRVRREQRAQEGRQQGRDQNE